MSSEEEDYRRKRPRNMFLDTEAIVDDHDEDEDEYDDFSENEDFIKDDEEELLAARDIYSQRAPRKEKETEIDLEAEEERLKSLYGKQTTFEDAENVPQQFLLPKISSPKLFLLSCKIGRENEICRSLIAKMFRMADTETPLLIHSVFSRNIKGYIYVEAYKPAHVSEAIKNVSGLYQKMKLVPIQEMVDAISIKATTHTFKSGSWVIFKRGKFKGDVAQVVDYDENGEVLTLWVVPRLNKVQKLFNPAEMQKQGTVSKSRGYWIYNGESYTAEGYLEKLFKVGAVMPVEPSLDQISFFAAGQSDVKGVTPQERFIPGDVVKVIEGDLINLVGTVESVDGNSISVECEIDKNVKILKFNSEQLQRYFKVGDHVKVVSGKHSGDLGLIVSVEDGIVTLFSDMTHTQVKVFSRDIVEFSQVITTNKNRSGIEFGDLVQIDSRNAGVVVSIEQNNFKIIDQTGLSRTVNEQQIFKKDLSRAVCNDSSGNQLRKGDIVQIVDGPHKNIKGNVLHIYRNSVFLKTKLTSDAGILVVRSNNLLIPGMIGKRTQMKPPSFRRSQPIGHSVQICSGAYKGYKGVVRELSNGIARVELDANSKIISIRSDLTQSLRQSGQSHQSNEKSWDGSQTATWDGNRTEYKEGSQTSIWRGNEGNTTTYQAGGRTAWEGSDTQYGDGKSDVNTGWKTPGLDSRTPAHETPAWDAKTPAHDAKTPAWDAMSMYSNRSRHSNRSRRSDKSSAGSVSRGPDSNLEPNIEVIYNSEFDTLIDFNQTTATLKKGGAVPLTEVTVVKPEKKDHVVILSGDKKGSKGVLHGIDGKTDGIFKLNESDEMQIIPLNMMGKLVE